MRVRYNKNQFALYRVQLFGLLTSYYVIVRTNSLVSIIFSRTETVSSIIVITFVTHFARNEIIKRHFCTTYRYTFFHFVYLRNLIYFSAATSAIFNIRQFLFLT